MIALPVIHLGVVAAFAALLLFAAVEDGRRFIIPNTVSLGIAILYPAHVLTTATPVDWLGAVGVAGAALVIGMVLFARRLIGGGDAKLIAAVALWAGPQHFVPFFFVTTLTGAAISLALLAHRRWLRPVVATAGSAVGSGAGKPALDLPYGIAIAAGGVNLAVSFAIGG
jgi:prepilin peptidase CpaA